MKGKTQRFLEATDHWGATCGSSGTSRVQMHLCWRSITQNSAVMQMQASVENWQLLFPPYLIELSLYWRKKKEKKKASFKIKSNKKLVWILQASTHKLITLGLFPVILFQIIKIFLALICVPAMFQSYHGSFHPAVTLNGADHLEVARTRCFNLKNANLPIKRYHRLQQLLNELCSASR